jgi:hypothetical protein
MARRLTDLIEQKLEEINKHEANRRRDGEPSRSIRVQAILVAGVVEDAIKEAAGTALMALLFPETED